MINKALRILIADPQHFHRMNIERLFNNLDYYRVAPVQTLAELLTLVDYGCEPFDVVVINADLATGALDLPGFFLNNPQVRHALIYNEASAPLQTALGFCPGQRADQSCGVARRLGDQTVDGAGRCPRQVAGCAGLAAGVGRSASGLCIECRWRQLSDLTGDSLADSV